MLTQSEIDSMRDHAELAMPDTGTITREGSGGTLNESTGVWTPAAASTIYTGKMRFVAASSASESDFGDVDITTAPYMVQVPWDAGAIEPGDRVDITVSSDGLSDGFTLRVVSVRRTSFLISRQLVCELLTPTAEN